MKQTFLIIILFIVFAFSAFAQTTSCNLQLDVYKFQDNVETDPQEIKKVSALLQKDNSKTTVKSVLQSEKPYFENLPAGNYNTIISMNGYKVTTKEINLDCSSANETNTVSEILFLWEGNTKERVKMNGGTFVAVGEKSDQSKELLPSNDSKPEEKGEVTGKAAYLPQPAYPPAARAVKATGVVQVEVLINELGTVVYAKAINGHPLLRTAAVKAAKEAKFRQTRLKGIPIKIIGIINYNFVL